MDEQPSRFGDEPPTATAGPEKVERAEAWNNAFWFAAFGATLLVALTLAFTQLAGVAIAAPVLLPAFLAGRTGIRERRALRRMERELDELSTR